VSLFLYSLNGLPHCGFSLSAVPSFVFFLPETFEPLLMTTNRAREFPHSPFLPVRLPPGSDRPEDPPSNATAGEFPSPCLHNPKNLVRRLDLNPRPLRTFTPSPLPPGLHFFEQSSCTQNSPPCSPEKSLFSSPPPFNLGRPSYFRGSRISSRTSPLAPPLPPPPPPPSPPPHPPIGVS